MRLWQQHTAAVRWNCVQGGRETGQALSALEDPDGLLFTGSYYRLLPAIASSWSAGENFRPL